MKDYVIYMTEYYTKALILERTPRGEYDERILMYTKDLGKIFASAKSVKRIGSKLSGHLNVGKLVNVRLVKKNSFQIVDAISEGGGLSLEGVKFLRFINSMTPFEMPDYHLWHGIWYVVSGGVLFDGSKTLPSVVYRRFLEILGFGAKFARCNNCNAVKVSHFHPQMLIFLCSDSHKKLFINEEETIAI